MILVDAMNAFNSLNRQVALRNIRHLCPALSKFLINTYRDDVRLYINGETMLSQEGTTQGDPLAMAMYAIAVNPLIHRLKQDTTKQIWFADDATGGGKLNSLREWWDHLTTIGPAYGYFPNALKTSLIVKEGYKDEAVAIFERTQVVVTEEGKKYLGSAIGKQSFIESYVQQKVASWVDELERLSCIATTQPHAAFAALTHGLSSRWTYLARTISHIEDLIKPLKEAIKRVFLPSLTNRNAFNNNERDMLAVATTSPWWTWYL